MKVLITGAFGFIGKHLKNRLDSNCIDNIAIGRGSSLNNIYDVTHIIHLAGTNRSTLDKDFYDGNVVYTKEILDYFSDNFKKNSLQSFYYASSIQAEQDNLYGITKRQAEHEIEGFCSRKNIQCNIMRLTNIYGPNAKPNYNSVVATFASKIKNKKTYNVIDKSKIINLLHVDVLVDAIYKSLVGGVSFPTSLNSYSIHVGDIAKLFELIQVVEQKHGLQVLKDFINIYECTLGE